MDKKLIKNLYQYLLSSSTGIIFLLFLLLFITTLPQVSVADKDQNKKSEYNDGGREFEKFDKLLKNYESRARPNYGGDPVQVGVTAYILSIPEFNSPTMSMKINLYFRQTWKDPRLAFEGNKSITLIGPHADRIWVPDTFFVNSLKSSGHETTVPNSFTRIFPDGQILKSVKYTLQLSCPMGSAHFPFDDVACHIDVESYSYTMSDIVYKWGKGNSSFGICRDFFNTEFTYRGYLLEIVELSRESGNYSRLSIAMMMRRISNRYLTEFFVPLTVLGSVAVSSLLVADSRTAVMFNVLMLGMTVLFLTISSGLQDLDKTFPENALILFSKIHYSFILLSLIINIAGLYLAKQNKISKTILQKVGTLQHDRVPQLRIHNNEEEDPTVGGGGTDEPDAVSVRTAIKQMAPSRTLAVRKKAEEIVFKILPAIKILLLSSYATANLIYLFVYPAHHHADDDALTADGWHLV